MIEESTGSQFLSDLYKGGMSVVDIAVEQLATGGISSIKSLAKGMGAFVKAVGDDVAKAFIKTYGDDAIRAIAAYGDDAGKMRALNSADDATKLLLSSGDDAGKLMLSSGDDMVDNWNGLVDDTVDGAASSWDDVANSLDDVADDALAAKPNTGYNGSTGAIKTPYGDALQSNSKESLALRQYVDNGGKLYRGGNLGRSYVADGQFWAPESPLSFGYADNYGVDFNNLDFIVRGKQMNGAPYITRPAPGLRINPGGALEVVNNPYSVLLDYFHMP